MAKYFYLVFFILIAGLYSCSKKTHPAASTTPVNTDTLTVNKVVKRKVREPIPKVITVSDSGAHKTVDGRYYYDLQGHRYWRNNKDGKYYLFNKSMYQNDDFKPTGN